MKKPNILFIMTDQQRWDAMGCSGDWVKTPNIDRIAKEGLRFSNCITNSPVCIPTRVALATGLYPHNTGIWKNIDHDMPGTTNTWMQVIRNAGYRTSLFGKTHLHRHNGDLRDRVSLMNEYGLDDVDEIAGPRASVWTMTQMTEGWDKKDLLEKYQDDYKERFSVKPHVVRPSALPLSEYADVYVGEKANEYLENYQLEQPWFCWVSFGGPHEPWDTPEPYASMYKPEDMPAAVSKPSEDSFDHGNAIKTRLSKAPGLSTKEISELRADYAGNVTLIDDQIGQILKTLEAKGELDNTIIAFTSDHGELNGDYGLIYKSVFLNGAVRIPLLLRTPESIGSSLAGTVVESPVELIDLGATLAELSGGKITYQQFGKSLCPLLENPAIAHREFAISEIAGEIMYMDKKWKLALNAKGQPYMLFNLLDDPHEEVNLIHVESCQDISKDLRIKILEHMTQHQVYKES